MDPREINLRLYQSFAEGCDARRTRLFGTLEAFTSGQLSVDDALNKIAVDLHEHIGDAKLIALHKVSSTAVEMEKLVRKWKDRLLPPDAAQSMDQMLEHLVHSEAFRSWIERLMEISKRYALSPGDTGHVRELQNLRMMLEKAMDETTCAEPRYDTAEVRRISQKRILLLDDSPISRELLQEVLEDMGHVVTGAESAEQFWTLMDDVKPDAVFLDINMPDAQGDDLCRQIKEREDTRDIPVVIFSSLSDEELESVASAAGASGFVSKQDGFDELGTYLARLIEKGVI